MARRRVLDPTPDPTAPGAGTRPTALDRPPEEASEDTSFARGLKVVFRDQIRGIEAFFEEKQEQGDVAKGQ